MSLACEAEVGVQNELALRFTIVSKPTPVLEYIKTISSLVGASHILAVFEENDTLKVFFDDRRFVDLLIRSGIHVMGHHVRVDYVIPPGTKVVLSNIDPVVSNYDLMKLLSMYGSIVSPIICPPISDDMEFCHIGYGVRYCYMTIGESIPNKLEFKYGEQHCLIKIRTDEEMTLIPFIKSDECDLNDTELASIDCIAGPSSDDNAESTNPVVVSVESNVSESNPDVNDPVKMPITRDYVKRKGRLRKTLKVKRTKVTATTRAAKKIKQNFQHKWIGTNRIRSFKRGKKRGKKPIRLLKKSLRPPPLIALSPTSSAGADDNLSPPLLITEDKEHSEGPLNEEKLLVFIDECKHNRTPLELAKKYLGNDCNNGIIHNLIDQIDRHSKNSSCQSLKLRLGRLCKILTESVNNFKSQ